MSELKAYIGPAPDEKGLADYYLKSEADKVIAEKDAQILDLIERVQKERSAKVDYKVSANDLSDGLKKAYEEIRRLRRALYKACANWAKSERYTEATWHGDEHREELWAEVQDKCLAKADEFKEYK